MLLSVLAVTVALRSAEDAPHRDQIKRLVGELAADAFQTRQAAEDALLEFGPEAVSALELATRDPDPEVSQRAKRALAAIQKAIAARTHQLLDAEGKPIKGAALAITAQSFRDGVVTEVGTTKSDAWGYVSMRHVRGPGSSLYATVSDPQLGRARVRLTSTDKVETVTFPLVSRDSDAYERALKGQVVDPEGNPVSNAAVSCSEIRTPGEGLITSYDSGAVLTDDHGRFALYPLPYSQRSDQRGTLIPPNSRFHLEVRPADGDSLFP